MEVGKWRCDIREGGAYDGQRVATVLKPNNDIESQLEWADREGDEISPPEEQGLVMKMGRSGGIDSAPRQVIEWLMTGDT